MMHDLLQDIRYALRAIAKAPGFAAVVIFTLAIGIGVNTTVFIAANAVLFRPYPYQDPGRLVAVMTTDARTGETGEVWSYPDFHDVRAEARSFTAMAAYRGESYNLAAAGAEPERVEGGSISATMFPLLGARPVLGRTFREDEDRPGADQVVLLSDALWRRQFGADSAIVGRAILLNGVPHTVVGVMAPGFNFPESQQLWTPLQLSPTENRGAHFLSAVARLKPGVTVQGAAAELAGLMQRLAVQYPETNRNFGATARGLRETEVGDTRVVLYIMMGAVGFVLLIACANVANLLLARASNRQREVAIRTALGASRGRIVRQLLTESVILALAGAAGGVLVALWGNDLMARALPSDRAFWMQFTLDWRVLTFTIAVAVGTGLLFGLAPALSASRPDLGEHLKEGGQGAGTSRGRHRLRSGLVVAEVALSLVLLVGAGLLTRSFLAIQQADPGFDRANLLSMRVYLSGPGYDSTWQRSAFLRDVLQRVEAIPGVRSAAWTNFVPLTRSQSITVIQPQGKQYAPGEQPLVSLHVAYGDLAPVLRIPVKEGRSLTERDVADTTRMVMINETMAKRVWPGEDALGRRFHMAGEPDTAPYYTVGGIIGDIRARRLTDPPENQIWFPYTDWEFTTMTLLVRAENDPLALVPAVRGAIHQRDPNLPVFGVASMDRVFRDSFWEKRLYGLMFAAFAGIALVLAAVGLYAVIAYAVAQRTREIGVRMALGAGTADVVGMVVRHGLVLAATGLGIGLVASAGITRVLQSLLYGVSARDPLVFTAVAAMLALIALAASAIPARRASRVDPMHALRAE